MIEGNRVVPGGPYSYADPYALSDNVGLGVKLPEFDGECECHREDGNHVIDLHGAIIRGGLSIPRGDMIVRNGTFLGVEIPRTALRFWSWAGWRSWLGHGAREARLALAQRIAP